MLKKIKVNDTRILNVGGITTNSPFTRVLDEKDMRRLLETRPPLTGMYIVNSDGRMLPLTFENYKTGLQELFPAIKSAAAETVVKETPVVAKEEPVVEETVEEAPVVEETVAEEVPIEELFDTLKDDEGNEVELPEGDLNAEPEEVVEETVAENNQNDNVANMTAYINNKKNKKYKK